MVTKQIYGYMDFAVRGPVRDEADWMKGREGNDIGELDMSSVSKSGAKMALVIDFTTRNIALRYELPDAPEKPVVAMHEPPVDWRTVNQPTAEGHEAWQKAWDAAHAEKSAEPAKETSAA